MNFLWMMMINKYYLKNKLTISLKIFLSALRNHVLAVHEKLKPYLCDICGYAASAKANLVIKTLIFSSYSIDVKQVLTQR